MIGRTRTQGLTPDDEGKPQGAPADLAADQPLVGVVVQVLRVADRLPLRHRRRHARGNETACRRGGSVRPCARSTPRRRARRPPASTPPAFSRVSPITSAAARPMARVIRAGARSRARRGSAPTGPATSAVVPALQPRARPTSTNGSQWSGIRRVEQGRRAGGTEQHDDGTVECASGGELIASAGVFDGPHFADHGDLDLARVVHLGLDPGRQIGGQQVDPGVVHFFATRR